MKRTLTALSLVALVASCDKGDDPTPSAASDPSAGTDLTSEPVEIPTVEEAADESGIDESNADAEFEALMNEIESDT